MVAAICAVDTNTGCISRVVPVKRQRIVHGVHGGDPRASRSALTSDGAARVGRCCGPPGAIRGPSGTSGSVFESPALVAGFEYVAVVREAVEQGRGHLGVGEDGWPFGKGELGR